MTDNEFLQIEKGHVISNFVNLEPILPVHWLWHDQIVQEQEIQNDFQENNIATRNKKPKELPLGSIIEVELGREKVFKELALGFEFDRASFKFVVIIYN